MTITEKKILSSWLGVCLIGMSGLVGSVQASDGSDAYRAMGVKAGDVLSGTSLNAKVVAGSSKQLVSVVTYLTGKREKADAVNVRLMVFQREGDKLRTIYSRDLGQERGGFVGDGNLQVIDLDMDGVNEIIFSYSSFSEPLIDQELSEVITHDEDAGFDIVWSGPIKYDATRAARELPVERRDRYTREFDLIETLRTRGLTLMVNKTVIAVAGERLAEPKVVQEAFPLKRQ